MFKKLDWIAVYNEASDWAATFCILDMMAPVFLGLGTVASIAACRVARAHLTEEEIEKVEKASADEEVE